MSGKTEQKRIIKFPESERQMWLAKARKFFQGKTIVNVDVLTNEELEDMEWNKSPIVFEFDDGSWAYASSNNSDEMPGSLITSDKSINLIPTI